MTTFTFDPDGTWSGGGSAILSNVTHAISRYPELNGGSDAVPIYPRNVPTSRRLPRHYVLGPQNAWPWSTGGTLIQEWPRLAALRLASDHHLRRAPAVHRTSSAIPVLGNPRRYSPVIHNPLDPAFEDALESSLNETVPEAKKRFVVIGSAHSYRNLNTVIDAYRLYRGEGGTTGLFIAGPVGARRIAQSLESAARDLPDVTLRWGKLSRSRALAAMRDARAVILPSRVEASPFSALEAACMNETILPANTLGTHEILAEYGPAPASAFFPTHSAPGLAARFHDPDNPASSGWHDALSDWGRREGARVEWGDELVTWLNSLDFGMTDRSDA